MKIYVKDKTQPVYLKAYRNGELLGTYEYNSGAGSFEDEESRLNLDWVWDVPERHGFLAEINYKGEILNGIRQVYHYTGLVVAVLSFLAYLALSLRLLVQYVRKLKEGRERNLEQWLVLSSLLASYLVLLGGISYSEISGWNAILYWYLSGAYPVMTAFEILALLFSLQILKTDPIIKETKEEVSV